MVLVIDDNPIDQVVICSHLNKYGLKNICASSEAAAITVLKMRRIKVVVLDWSIVGEDFIDQAQKRMPIPTVKIPIIINSIMAKKDFSIPKLSYFEITAALKKPTKKATLYAVLDDLKSRKYLIGEING